MFLQGFAQRWRGVVAASLNCFSRLIDLISLIEIIGATTQCQGICEFLRHYFMKKKCAVKMDVGDVALLAVAEVRNELTQPFLL